MTFIHTRFAPSPTGRLHLGHAWSAILAHDFARAAGGRFTLRIEDIDGTRSRPEHVAAILADLEWLGLSWDDLTFQSGRLDLYQAALDRLKAMGLLYPCFCTRADIAASLTAPHGPEGAVYPGTCRGLGAPDLTRPHCWRLDVEKALNSLSPPERGKGPAAKRWEGRRAVGVTRKLPLSLPPTASAPSRIGSAMPPAWPKQRGALLTQCAPEGRGILYWNDHGIPIPADPASHGDIVLARKDAPASYHLAVTIDDAAQQVTHVIRGKDLFAATHVHRLLQALLGLPTPEYRHHDLLTGPGGQRLAKRHGAPALEAMRLTGADGRNLADQLRRGELPVGIAPAKD